MRRLVALLVVSLVALGACNGGGGDDGTAAVTTTSAADDPGDDSDDSGEEGDDEGASAATGEGCEILTQGDAEAVMGVDAEQADIPASGADQFVSAQCSWEAAGSLGFPSLMLQVFDGEQFYGGDTEGMFEGAEDLDVGDKGFIAASEGGATLQFVQDGRTVQLFLVSMGGAGEEGSSAAEAAEELKRVAALVADRL